MLKITNLLGVVKSRCSILKKNITNQFKYVSNKVYNIFKLQHKPGEVDSVLNPVVEPPSIPKQTILAPLLVNAARSTTNMVGTSVIIPQEVERKPSLYQERYKVLVQYYSKLILLRSLDPQEEQEINPQEILKKILSHLEDLDTLVYHWGANRLPNESQVANTLYNDIKERLEQTQLAFRTKLLTLTYSKEKQENDVTNLQNELEVLRSNAGQTQAHNAKKISECLTTIGNLTQEVINLKQKNLEAQTSLTFVGTTDNNNNTSQTTLLEEIKTLEQTGANLAVEVDDLKKKLTAANNKIREITLSLDNERALNDDHKVTINKLVTEKTGLEYQLNDMIAQIQTKQVDESTKEMESTMSKLSDITKTNDPKHIIIQVNKTVDITSKRFVTLLDYKQQVLRKYLNFYRELIDKYTVVVELQPKLHLLEEEVAKHKDAVDLLSKTSPTNEHQIFEAKKQLTRQSHLYRGSKEKLDKTLKEIALLKERIESLPTDVILEQATDQFVQQLIDIRHALQQVMPDDLAQRLEQHTKRIEELTIKPSSKLTKPSVAATPEGSLQKPSTLTRSVSSTNITSAASQPFVSARVPLSTRNIVFAAAAINPNQSSRSLPSTPDTPRLTTSTSVVGETID